jgi:signal transduction histidine kinase/PAS domain-containing protein
MDGPYEHLSRDELIDRLKADEAIRRELDQRRASLEERERLMHELQVHEAELEAQNQALREAQGLLEESRSRYADLYDFAPIAYCTFDAAGLVLEINLTGASLLGKQRSWIIGRPLRSLVRLHSPDAFLKHIRTALAATSPTVADISLVTPNGPMEFQVVSVAVGRSGGVAPKVCHTAFLDITPRRVAEREARAAHEAELSLRQRLEVIEQAGAAIGAALTKINGSDISNLLQVIVDQARAVGNAEYAALGIGGANARTFDPWFFSGITREHAATIGRMPRGVGLLGAVVHSGRPVRLRDLREHPAFGGFPGHHPPMRSFLGVPIRHQDTSGQIFLSNRIDADEFSEADQAIIERLAERAAVALELARLRQVELREQTRMALWAKAGPLLTETSDLATTLHNIARLVVPATADLASLEVLEEGGAVRRMVVHHRLPPKHRLMERMIGLLPSDRVTPRLRTAIETARLQRLELGPESLDESMTDPDHQRLLREIGAVSTIVVPLAVRDRVLGVLRLSMAESGRRYTDADLPLAQEIGRHAILALERARLQETARSATQARDELLAVVTQELRGELAGLQVAAEALAEGRGNGERRPGRKQVDGLRRSLARMRWAVDNLHDAGLLDAGQLALEPTAVEVAALLDEARGVLEPLAAAESLGLKLVVDDSPPPVRCDRTRVLQVLQHLVSNAVRFSPADGEVILTVRRTGSAVCFTVTDAGPGISSRDLGRLFERQYRGGQPSKNGTGLGLYICKGIVEAQGGSLWAESKVGAGSSFFFTLPLQGAREG